MQKGNNTSEVMLSVKAANGTVIYNRSSGTSYTGVFILKTFCLNVCPVLASMDVYVTMTDVWGDTWNGVVLAFRQGSTLQNFSLTTDGIKTYGPIKMTISRLNKVDLIVSQMGTWT